MQTSPPPLPWLEPGDDFPPVTQAWEGHSEAPGLLAAGGQLDVPTLCKAYAEGIFPWFSAGQPILWWSPDPRTVLSPDELHVSRSLRKLMRQAHYQVTFGQAFARIVQGCAEPREYAEGTWITSSMQNAYLELHRRGVAHSVEVWREEKLVGGLYGLAIGRLFFGESMFSREDNASKVGFATLVEHLNAWGFALIDCQMPTQHLQRFGAHPISRREFAGYLERHLDQLTSANWVA